MPQDLKKAYVDIPGVGTPSIQAMLDEFKAELAHQEKDFEGNYFPNDFPQKVKDDLDAAHLEAVSMIEEIITDRITTDMILGAIEGTMKTAYVLYNPLNEENPGDFGTFLERRLFGGQGDDRPTGDIDTFRGQLLGKKKAVEAKAKTGLRDIEIGKITVHGLDQTLEAEELKTIHNILMIYKTMIKMWNFIYMNIYKETVAGHSVIGFRVMTLYTNLYLGRLYSMITSNTSMYAGGLNIGVTQPKQPKDKTKPRKPPKYEVPELDPNVKDTISYKINYTVEMPFFKRDLIKGIAKIAQLYLRHSNLINEIETGGISSADFFGKLKRVGGWIRVD